MTTIYSRVVELRNRSSAKGLGKSGSEQGTEDGHAIDKMEFENGDKRKDPEVVLARMVNTA